MLLPGGATTRAATITGGSRSPAAFIGTSPFRIPPLLRPILFFSTAIAVVGREICSCLHVSRHGLQRGKMKIGTWSGMLVHSESAAETRNDDPIQLMVENASFKYQEDRGDSALRNVDLLSAVLNPSVRHLKKIRESLMTRKLGFYPESGGSGDSHPSLGFSITNHNTVISALCMNGKVGVALQLHRQLLLNDTIPSLRAYNHLVGGLCKMGEFFTAKLLVKKMQHLGVQPNSVTYNTFLSRVCCSESSKGIDGVLDLILHISENDRDSDVAACHALAAALYKIGYLEGAERLFASVLDQNSHSNLITFSILINRYCQKGDMEQALELWLIMLRKGIKPDRIVYNAIINGFHIAYSMKYALRYFCEMFKKGFLPDIITFNTLITGLCKEGKIDEVCTVFNSMSNLSVVPNKTSYEMLIHGLCLNDNIDKAVELLCKMLDESMVPETITWNVLIYGVAKHGNVNSAQSIRVQMVKCGVLPNIFTYNALLNAYKKRGDIINALQLKQEMIVDGFSPDVTTYNTLISAAFESHDALLALELLEEMQIEPDIITYTTFIQGFCKINEVQMAEKILDTLRQANFLIDHIPFHILIKKYCERGEVVKALSLYDEIAGKGFAKINAMRYPLANLLREHGLTLKESYYLLNKKA